MPILSEDELTPEQKCFSRCEQFWERHTQRLKDRAEHLERESKQS